MLRKQWRLVRAILILLGLAGPVAADTYRTRNFLVDAPTAEVAHQVGEAAERCRKDVARKWLGRELSDWAQPCPLHVKVTHGPPCGFTEVDYHQESVILRGVLVEGALEHLLVGVLPHEVTHTLFACHFGRPIPRWADEGGSVLAEDESVQRRHEVRLREVVADPSRLIPLRRLFTLDEFPLDLAAFYVQSYSVTRFLVEKRDRPTFLAFVRQGTEDSWDRALQRHYGYSKVEELERDWLAHLKSPGPEQGKDAAAEPGR